MTEKPKQENETSGVRWKYVFIDIVFYLIRWTLLFITLPFVMLVLMMTMLGNMGEWLSDHIENFGRFCRSAFQTQSWKTQKEAERRYWQMKNENERLQRDLQDAETELQAMKEKEESFRKHNESCDNGKQHQSNG